MVHRVKTALQQLALRLQRRTTELRKLDSNAAAQADPIAGMQMDFVRPRNVWGVSGVGDTPGPQACRDPVRAAGLGLWRGRVALTACHCRGDIARRVRLAGLATVARVNARPQTAVALHTPHRRPL